MDAGITCGAPVWGLGSIARPPIGLCVLIPGHSGEHKVVDISSGKVHERIPAQRELDIDLTCPYERWKPNRDICSPTYEFIHFGSTE